MAAAGRQDQTSNTDQTRRVIRMYRVSIVATIHYSREFEEGELREIVERVGLDPRDDELGPFLDDREVREVLEEELQRYGDVEGAAWTIKNLDEEPYCNHD